MSSVGAPVEMTRQTLATHAITSQTGIEVMAAQRGAFRGEVVATVDEGSKLLDMKEEIGNAFTAHKSSHLKSMQVRWSPKPGQAAKLGSP